MAIIQYTPEHFPTLDEAAKTAGYARSLRHRPFVDYYYANNEWCRLYLGMAKNGAVTAAIGIERLHCEHRGEALEIGIGSNFVSFKPGASAGSLFLHWVRTAGIACVFGGSPDMHKIIQSQKWTYFPGVRVYRVNGRYAATKRDDILRRAAKSILRTVIPRVDVRALGEAALARHAVGALRVEEERAISADMLPAPGAFTFRLASPLAHLNWRYATGLSFVRYRVFRILKDGGSCGYVVTNDKPDRIMVAHADGPDPETIAVASLLAVGTVGTDGDCRREVVLTAAHPRMQAVFSQAGFQVDDADRAFALGTKRGGVDLPVDTSDWSIHFDWTDGGLRSPFLDEREG